MIESDDKVEENVPDPQKPTPGQDKQELKREIIDFIKLVVWFLVIFLGLRTYVIEGYEVQGPSMTPTLQNNERILVFKLPHILSQFSLFSGIEPIKRGDIVVFDSPSDPMKRFVKRVIARGPNRRTGKTVVAESQDAPPDFSGGVPVRFDRGTVYVNEHRLKEEYLPPEARISTDSQELILGPGEYYVLGDNRGVSKDSRSFDAIRDDAIIGKAFLRFWPPTKVSLLR